MNCINCIYFLNCKEAEPNKRECKKFESKNMKLVWTDRKNYKFEKVED